MTKPISRWRLLHWRAPLLLGLGMGVAGLTQIWWVTLLGVAGYMMVLLADVLGEAPRPTGRKAAALAAGVLAVAAAALMTTFVQPIPFPLNFLVSLGLGAAMQFGAHNMLGPGMPTALVEAQRHAEYQALLTSIRGLGARIAAASRGPALPKVTRGQLEDISGVVASIAGRYEERSPDFVGASATLTILQQFDKVLDYYLKIKSGEQFVSTGTKSREIAATEGRTIPMISAALATLGKQLDAGEVLDKKIAEEALQSMLEALNLIGELKVDS